MKWIPLVCLGDLAAFMLFLHWNEWIAPGHTLYQLVGMGLCAMILVLLAVALLREV